MKCDIFAVASLLVFSSAPSLAHPQTPHDILVREDAGAAAFEPRDADVVAGAEKLWKRKGGGGGGGKGGGGGGSSSSGSGSSGSGSSGFSGSSGSSGSPGSSSSGGRTSGSSSSSSSSSSGKGSSTSSTGGSTKQGSGSQPSFNGGKYYGGGSTKPYTSGGKSPGGVAPILIGGAALAILPGLYLYGAYSYPYHNPYTFYNRTATANETSKSNTRRHLWSRETTGVNQTKPVTCTCAQYQECSCDDTGDTSFLDSIIGDGTYYKLNHSVVDVADVNGTSTIILNGTLENGTTIPGGTDDANAGAGVNGLLQSSGYLVMVALAGCTVLLV